MALPIISTCLTALGVGVTDKAAEKMVSVADAAVGKFFGKAGSQMLEEICSRLRAYSGSIPPNHDLEKALRLAELTSSLMVLEDYRV
jgi:hypothetical protein